MNDMNDPRPNPDMPMNVIPVRERSGRTASGGPGVFGMFFRWVFRLVFFVSVALNVFLLAALVKNPDFGGFDSGSQLSEKFVSGDRKSEDKIAILRLDGVIMDGQLGYVHQQIERAANDPKVKAIVLRINSPGGSITASDDLYKRFIELRDGQVPNVTRSQSKKPLIVSMGALAASGGYYAAMPAEKLLAERTTITGSIGVYASFPNIHNLSQKYGFTMHTIKAGDMKASGSMFEKMTDDEEYLWQTMVDNAYAQFVGVCETGRPLLKDKMREVIIDEEKTVKNREGKEVTFRYVRRRADGGIFTAQEALQYGLIDQIGYLDDAVAVAKTSAGLTAFKAVQYDKPMSLFNALMGAKAPTVGLPFDPKDITAGAVPRLWFLAPQSDLAGMLSAAGVAP